MGRYLRIGGVGGYLRVSRRRGPHRQAEGGAHEVGGYLRIGGVGGCLRVSRRRGPHRQAEGGAHEALGIYRKIH